MIMANKNETIPRTIDPEPGRVCRICGCHDRDACMHPEHGNCYWVEKNLCSHCKYWPGESKRYSELMNEKTIE